MQRTRTTLVFRSVLAWIAAAPLSRARAEALVPPPLLFGQSDLVRQKKPVPDDPLAGLPTGDDRGGKTGNDRRKGMCAISARAENDRDIGDLRATLAFVKHGPSTWPCPPRSAQIGIHLRIVIDGAGKITAVDPAAGDRAMPASMAKRLRGKVVDARAGGATAGTVIVTFATKGP